MKTKETVTERDEREARFLAREIPPEARIVALLVADEGEEKSSQAADAIATSLGRRREHTLLASCEPGGSALDRLLGGGESEGLQSALDGRVRLSEIAIRRSDRPFVYLPAGTSAPPPAGLVGSEAFRGFADRVRARGGTLLLHLPVDALSVPAVCEALDGCLALGTVDLPAGCGIEPWGRVRFDGVVGGTTAPWVAPPTRATDAAEVEGEPVETLASRNGTAREPAAAADIEEPAGWRRHRMTARPPWGLVAIAVLGIGALVGGWWIIARGSLGGAGDRPEATGSEPVAPAGPPPAAAGPPPGVPDEAALAAADGAPELGYSVLVASYADRADAEQRLVELAPAAGELFFIAPTAIRGVVYHRVFAGALAELDAGLALMDVLVTAGRKEDANDWHVRPSRLAFRLGVFGSRESAETRLGEARSDGIPGYLIPVPVDADTAYQLYAGAYVTERSALVMADILERQDWEAELVARRGGSR